MDERTDRQTNGRNHGRKSDSSIPSYPMVGGIKISNGPWDVLKIGMKCSTFSQFLSHFLDTLPKCLYWALCDLKGTPPPTLPLQTPSHIQRDNKTCKAGIKFSQCVKLPYFIHLTISHPILLWQSVKHTSGAAFRDGTASKAKTLEIFLWHSNETDLISLFITS